MSLSSFSNITVLIKKIARKSTLRRKITSKKQQRHQHTTTTQDQDLASVSTCSTNDEEKSHTPTVPVTIKSNHKEKDIVVIASVPSEQCEDAIDATTGTTTTTTTTTTIVIEDDFSAENTIDTDNSTTLMTDCDNDKDVIDEEESETVQQMNPVNPVILIRDFAYPADSPLHHGPRPMNDSQISLSSSRFNGRQAKALYDFSPETEYEIAMESGQLVWIQYRQCAGWLIADVGDETGLVPESYIEFI